MSKTAAIALILLVPFALFAQEAPSPFEIREALAESAAAERSLATLSPSESLGNWKDSLETCLFLLLRKTEIYRGPLSIEVSVDGEIDAWLFPGSTFRVTSALLDDVDALVLETVAASASRERNLDDIRERIVVPWLAFEVSRFALDQPYAAAKRYLAETGRMPGSRAWDALTALSAEEVAAADRFALILLAAAGYDPKIYFDWLSRLDARYRSGAAGGMSRYLSALPSPALRLDSLSGSADETARDSAEMRSSLANIASGQALDEISFSLDRLDDRYPGSPWILRLRAFAAHLAWLSSVDSADLGMATVLPFARTGSAEFDRLSPLLAPSNDRSTATKAARTATDSWASARTGYETIRGVYFDPVLESAYAMLLVYSRIPELATQAIRVANEAALAEEGQTSFTARANRAAVLALSGNDTQKSAFLLENLVHALAQSAQTGIAQSQQTSGVQPTGNVKAGVPMGSPGDSRILFLNAILAAERNGDSATALRLRLGELANPRVTGTISVRALVNGDGPDELLDKWGHPAEIVYNLVTETWYYPGLLAAVAVLPESGSSRGRILSITAGYGSPISPGADVRTGDAREAFETAFGKPAWRSGDRDTYLVNGNLISSFYIGGGDWYGANATLREIRVEFAGAGK